MHRIIHHLTQPCLCMEAHLGPCSQDVLVAEGARTPQSCPTEEPSRGGHRDRGTSLPNLFIHRQSKQVVRGGHLRCTLIFKTTIRVTRNCHSTTSAMRRCVLGRCYVSMVQHSHPLDVQLVLSTPRRGGQTDVLHKSKPKANIEDYIYPRMATEVP